MPVSNPSSRSIITTARVQKCDGCGRTLPKGSKVLRWQVWVDGEKYRVRFCSDCQEVVSCDVRRPFDIQRDVYTYMCREICEHCDEFPMCAKADYIRGSEVGDVWFGDLTAH